MKSAPLLRSRQQKILSRLQQAGVVRVDDLSKELQVAAITVRRDLDWLHQQGLLERIHGGALPLKNQQKELSFENRKKIQIQEKIAIGQTAAEMISDNAIVFLTSGSTTLEVIRHLQHRQVQVITNNVDALQLPVQSYRPPTMELITVGGVYRYQSHSLSGDLALASIENIYSSYTILGVNGIHPEYGVTNSWFQHVSLYKRMIQNCKGEVIVVADSSKIDVISNFVCASINQVSKLVTNHGANEKNLEKSLLRFRELGLEVIEAPETQ